jgi:hypothetical protein
LVRPMTCSVLALLFGPIYAIPGSFSPSSPSVELAISYFPPSSDEPSLLSFATSCSSLCASESSEPGIAAASAFSFVSRPIRIMSQRT